MRTTRVSLGFFCLYTGLLIACGNKSSDSSGPGIQEITLAPTASGNGQIALVDAYLPDPLHVLVTEDGFPAEGVNVSWATSGPGATVGSNSITGVDGIAQASWKLSQTSGPQAATATVAGASGSPVTFTAIGLARSPTSIVKTGGDNQTQTVSTPFDDPLALQLSDTFGNGTPGVDVEWEVTSGSVVLDAPTSRSALDGTVTISVVAGSTPGSATITATPVGGVSSVTFTLTVKP